jgi:pyruvate,water dikinase
VRQAIDAYLDEFGWQVFTGFDFTHQAMIELPSLLLSTLRTVGRVPAHTSDRLSELLAKAPPEHRDRAAQLIDDAITLYGVRDDDSGLTIQQPLGLARRALLEAGRRAAAAGRLRDPDHIFDASRDDLDALITGNGAVPHVDDLSARSVRRHNPFIPPPLRLGDDDAPPDDELPPAMGTIVGALLAAMSQEVADPRESTADQRELRGCGASPGVYEGRARVVNSDGGFEHVEAGDILIATMTTPAYNVVVPLLGAVVTDTGGMLCHAAIVAREFAIPAVVGAGTATTDIPDGAHIRVDGNEGTVTLL